jgi:hypothetical protein
MCVSVILSACGCVIPLEGSFTIRRLTLAFVVLLTFCTNPRKPGRPTFLELSDETIFGIRYLAFRSLVCLPGLLLPLRGPYRTCLVLLLEYEIPEALIEVPLDAIISSPISQQREFP